MKTLKSKKIELKKENWKFIPQSFVPMNEETKRFLEEHNCRKFHNPHHFAEEMYVHQQNPCPDTLKVVHYGRVEGPYRVALVGTCAFKKGSPSWNYFQDLKNGKETVNYYLNLEEREDGLYVI